MAESNCEDGVVVGKSLIDELLMQSGYEHDRSVGDGELVLLYSLSDSETLVIEKFEDGEQVYAFEERGDDVYFSSVVSCLGSINLSLLSRGLGETNVTSSSNVQCHVPRRLLRISSHDPRDDSSRGRSRNSKAP
jgi:hypothetical protein